jgi:ParB family chromosome partitioning protein
LAKSNAVKIKLPSVDDLFSSEESRQEAKLTKIYDISISEIDDFPNHPFKVRDDEDMDALIESIKERGVITPATVRKLPNGRYEMISGHRRKRACEKLGMGTLRCEVVDLNKEEATILMVESNFQRSIILPSEKAFAYKMRLDAMKRQGERTDLTSPPVAGKSRNMETADVIGTQLGDSGDQVRRYIRLTELTPDLLEKVDEGKIAMRPAVELSYLRSEEQANLVEAMEMADATPSHAQAIKMKRFSQEGRLTPEVIESIMTEEKPNQKEKFNIPAERIRKWIPKEIPQKQAEDYILKALEFYHRHLEMQRLREQEYER